MTSRQPYWCPKTMKRRPCWCPKPILWELNSFLMQTLSFVPIDLHRCWPCEWKRSIARTWKVGQGRSRKWNSKRGTKAYYVPAFNTFYWLKIFERQPFALLENTLKIWFEFRQKKDGAGPLQPHNKLTMKGFSFDYYFSHCRHLEKIL